MAENASPCGAGGASGGDIAVAAVVDRDDEVHHHGASKRPEHHLGCEKQKCQSEKHRIEDQLHPARAEAGAVLHPDGKDTDAAKARPVAEQRQQARPGDDPEQERGGQRIEPVEADGLRDDLGEDRQQRDRRGDRCGIYLDRRRERRTCAPLSTDAGRMESAWIAVSNPLRSKPPYFRAAPIHGDCRT